MNRLCQLPAFILRYMRHSNAFAISSDFSAIAFSANISIIKENERNRWLIYESKAFSLLRFRLRQLSVFYLYGNKGCRAREEADWKVFHPQKTFTTDDLICFGCHADTASAHKFCAECAIRLCSIGRGLQSCGQCKDFPCPTLTRSIHSDTPSYELLLKIHAENAKTWTERPHFSEDLRAAPGNLYMD